MRFAVLGPLLVFDDAGRPRPVPVAQHRRLLSALLLKANQAIPLDELADVLWDGQPPAGARATLRNYVKLLRRGLGPDVAGRLLTRPPGYLIEIGDDELDRWQFTRLCHRGREAAREQRWVDARDDLASALVLWRGPAFADVSLRSVQQTEVPHLAELRLQALEWRIEADLRLGRHDELVWELQHLVEQHPLRERFREHLMLALYRVGRQSEALAAYQSARSTLRDDLGIEPGPALQAMQRRILDADTTLMHDPPTAPPPAPRPAQLPLDVRGFTARDSELAQLDALIATTEGRPPAVPISAVSGTAGVGKTALAVHWAHRVAGQFPDGQLYLNLRGFDPSGARLRAEEALRGLLEALGVAPQRIPVGLDAQAALYRSTLAGRRMLIVLDNARDDDQVRPLLPGSPGCLVVVTSRNRLSGLIATEGARPLLLDLLDVSGARRLIAERIGVDRLLAEPEAVDDIIERCARLPLALAVVAARAMTHPAFSLRDLAAELTHVQTALDAFDSPDPASDLRAVLSCSYQALSADAARLFRHLGIHPGPSIATPAVASLAGLPVGSVRPMLAELTHAHLLTEYRPGRYTFHDLLRAYATELAGTADHAGERAAAVRRISDHYLRTAHRAALRLRPHRDPLDLAPVGPGVTPEDLADQAAASSWFAAEHAVLLGVMALAERARLDREVWQLAWACSEFFERHGKWQLHVSIHHAAQAAAERIRDRVGQAHAHRGLGLGYARLGRYDDANVHLECALALSRQLGDHTGEARTHNNTGWVFEVQGRYVEAIGHAQQALELYRASGHQAGQANALNNIGWYHALNGDYAPAIEHCGQALAIHTAIGDRLGQAATCDSIGYAHYRLGDHRQAIPFYLRASELFREFGNRYQEAATLTNLGDAYRASGDDESARQVWRRALAALDELGHADAEQVRVKLAALPAPVG